jgi:predicted DNA-binding ribbon-helix-helix protein
MSNKDRAKSGALFESRTVVVDGQPCHLRVEPSYWEALDEICGREGLSIEELCSDLQRRLSDVPGVGEARVDTDRVSLANAVRVFSVGYFRQAATETGHNRAGHGRGNPFTATPFDSIGDTLPH